MKKTSASSGAAKPAADHDGNPVTNRILLHLAREDCNQILSRLEFVRFKRHLVLYEPGETIKSACFVNAGLMSILAVQPDGKSVEAGLTGREGFAGLPLLMGYTASPIRLIAQADGSAFRCDAATLRQLLQEFPELEVQFVDLLIDW